MKKTNIKLSNIQMDGWISNTPETKDHIDTRTKSEIIAKLFVISYDNPELREIPQHLHDLDLPILRLIADITSIAKNGAFRLKLADSIRYNEIYKDDILYIRMIKNLIQVANNKGLINMLSQIIKHADVKTIKSVFANLLCDLHPIYKKQDAAFDEIAKIMPSLLKDTITGASPLDYCEQNEFINLIKHLSQHGKNHNLIKHLPNLAKTNIPFYVDDFITMDAPEQKITENMETLKKISKIQNAKNINVVNFLKNNVNIK